jgi:hypothetical protein
MQIQWIRSQVQLDQLLERFDWSHGFVREAYLVSPTYVDGGCLGTVAPESSAALLLLFTFPDRQAPGLELVFEGVVQTSLAFRVDLDPVGVVDPDSGSVEIRLSEDTSIRAAALKYILLGEECWGDQLRYGKADLVGHDPATGLLLLSSR